MSLTKASYRPNGRMGNGKTMEEVSVDDRGRILIPKHMRDRLGLRPGSSARLEVDEGKLVITPPVSPDEFIRNMEGCIKEGTSHIDPLQLKRIWEKPLSKQ